MDTTKDWLVAGFPVELRQLIVKKAKADGVTVGEWLAAVLPAHVVDGTRVTAPVRPRRDAPALPELVTCAVALAGAGMPRALRRLANKAVAERYAQLISPPEARIEAPAPQLVSETPDTREDIAASP